MSTATPRDRLLVSMPFVAMRAVKPSVVFLVQQRLQSQKDGLIRNGTSRGQRDRPLERALIVVVHFRELRLFQREHRQFLGALCHRTLRDLASFDLIFLSTKVLGQAVCTD